MVFVALQDGAIHHRGDGRSYGAAMGWFRRSRSASTTDAGPSLVPAAIVSAASIARTERALQMLASQSAQLHSSIVRLEHRVDAMSTSMLERIDGPSYQDMVRARLETAKVAAELSRLEVNLACRIDDLRAQVFDPDVEIDLRELTPADTGW